MLTTDGYFLPFVGQANPLCNLSFAKSPKYSFDEYTRDQPFTPINSPKQMWIAFNMELSKYISDVFSRGITFTDLQFRNFLYKYLGDGNGMQNYYFPPPSEILNVYTKPTITVSSKPPGTITSSPRTLIII